VLLRVQNACTVLQLLGFCDEYASIGDVTCRAMVLQVLKHHEVGAQTLDVLMQRCG
jgi:hypothetical protein